MALSVLRRLGTARIDKSQKNILRGSDISRFAGACSFVFGASGALNPLVHRTTNAILMSFSSYPASIKRFFPYIYRDPAPFARDSALVAEVCEINRTPNARDPFYWMQRALHFDFAIPDVTRIKSVAVPTLIVWGRNDRIVEVRTSTSFQQDIAGSRLVVIDDAGHAVQEEKPDAVNRAITSFLDAIRW